MGRKKPEPRRMDEDQRHLVDWNMAEVVSGPSAQQPSTAGDLVIIPDDDPTLALELKAAAKNRKPEKEEKAEHIVNGVSRSSSDSTTGTVQLPGSHADKMSGAIVPDNVRAFFRRLDSCMHMAELKDHYLRLPMYSEEHSRSREVMVDWHWVVGKFQVKLRDHDSLPVTSQITQCLSQLEQCWLYIGYENESDPVVHFEVYDEEMKCERQDKEGEEANGSKPATAARRLSGSSSKKKQATEDHLGMFWVVELEFSDSWKFFQKLSRSGQKKFQLVYGNFDSSGRQFEVTVYGRKDSLQKLDYPSQGFVTREVNNFLFEAMNHFHSLGPMYGKADRNLHQDFHELYEGVRALQLSQPVFVAIDVQHPSLKPVLRPYQRDAVRWMLQRERFGQDHDDEEEDESAEGEGDLHPLYMEVTTHCGKTLYYNRQGGSLIQDRPRKVRSPPGGILADEMGLGKTVEVLCCMLLHPRPHLPLPTRLPTLMDMESEEKSMESSGLSTSSSLSDLSSLGTCVRKNSESENQMLKRVDSDSGSVSSVPSDVVSYVVTSDHSYPTKPGNDSEDSHDDDEDPENLTSSSSAHHPMADNDRKAGGDFKSPMRPTFKRVSSNSRETLSEESNVNGDSDLQPQTKKHCTVAENKKLKVQDIKKRKGRKGKTGAKQKGSEIAPEESNKRKGRKGTTGAKQKGSEYAPEESNKLDAVRPKPPKRKLKTPEVENGSEAGIAACKKNKRGQSGKYFYYATDENLRPHGLLDQVVLPPRQQLFECVCGKGEHENGSSRRSRNKRHPVKCTECGTSQHAKCMNYDLGDPFRGPYKCPHCHYNGAPLPSGATLIISPYSIAHQWLEEIKKHVQAKSIRVFEYTGVRYQGYIQPQTLASQDIVITTYETLRNELNYVDLKPTNSEQGRVLRNPKKFMAQPTPLTAVQWWRICLDEAQMVESVTTKTAEMALRLSCVNRWCVTGTPLNQSIKDLYGLLAFIGCDPYCVEEWWRRHLYEPYLLGVRGPMFQALAKVMWRTAMKHVKSQLNLPDRSEVVKHLTFSPVEDVFYQRLYQNCSNEIMGPSSKLSEKEKSTTLRKLDHQTVNKYLNPLRKLRQACCHPQAVSGSNLSMRSSVMTMEELLENLIKKTMLECVESHRCMIAAMNGQAGIYLIEDHPRVAEAVDLYREVLRSGEELERGKQVKTDCLPQVHAMHNLAQVLDTRPPGVGHTTRDDHLLEQIEQLKKQYLQRTGSIVAAGKEQLAPVHQSVTDITKQLGRGIHWYQQVMQHAVQAGNEAQLQNKVNTSLDDLHMEFRQRFTSVSGLQFIIVSELSQLQTLREEQIKCMKDLETYDLKEEVILCCLRPPDGLVQRTCAFCEMEKNFLHWEAQLFWVNISQRTLAGVENALYRDGSWQDSPLETSLKALYSYAKNQHLEGHILKDAAMALSLFEVWKKEFKHFRAQWTKLKEAVNAEDELEMAVTRMRLRLPGEQGSKDVMNVCEKVELPAMLKKFASDQMIYTRELKLRCGQLDYLRHLAKGHSGEFQDGINPEECPICKSPLGRNWSVMRCGHCCCLTCIQHLIDRCPLKRIRESFNIRCMICRETTSTSDISYISTSRTANNETSVKGSHSTKVKAILQCIQNIVTQERQAKTLVFATWVEVLKVIGKALEDNNISYTQLFDHGSNYERNVRRFRTDESVRVLLLPYSTGSKGLNLFEASHVLLVEPTYSPSEEAQAIGRVYRMGQTRPTTVHRFLVKRTIEERIHGLMESTLRSVSNANEMDKDAITLGQLIALFEKQENNEDTDDDDDGDDGTSQVDRAVGPLAGPSRSTSGLDHLPDAMAGPSSRPDDVTAPSSRPDDVTGPSSRPDDVTGPSSRPDDVTGPSSMPDDVTGPSSMSDDVTGPSSRSDDVTGPSSRPDDVTGSRSMPDDVTGSSSMPDDVTGSSSMPDDVTGSSSMPGDVTGSSCMPGDVTESSCMPDDVTGSSSMPDVTGSSSMPDDVTRSSSMPGDVTGSSCMPDDVTGSSSRPDDVTGSSSRPDDVTGPSSMPDVTGSSSSPDVTGSSSSPDDVTGSSSSPDVTGSSSMPDVTGPSSMSDVTGPSSRSDDVTGSSSRPDDVTGSSSRPDDVTEPSSMPDDVTGPSSRQDDVTELSSRQDDVRA